MEGHDGVSSLPSFEFFELEEDVESSVNPSLQGDNVFVQASIKCPSRYSPSKPN